jgi:hypothetical protein
LGCVGDRSKIQTALLQRTPLKPSPPGDSTMRTPGTLDSLRAPLVQLLLSKFAEVSRIPVGAITASDSLEHHGLDSILAVEFSQTLQRDFSDISSNALFEHDTISALAEFLLKEYPLDCTRLFPSAAAPPQTKASHGNGHLRSALLVPTAAQRTFPNGNGNGHALNGREDFPPSNGSVLSKQPRTIPFAPMDYLFLGRERLSIQIFYWFEHKLDFDLLRSGLEKVCHQFFPANSQLLRLGESEFAIRECGSAPDFQQIHCAPGTPLPTQGCPESFLPYRLDIDPEAAGDKFARFRLFQFESGSLLGVNMSHAIADGYSFYYFMGAWASACQHLDFSLPDHSREKLNLTAEKWLARERTATDDLLLSIPVIDPSFSIVDARTETFSPDPAALFQEESGKLTGSAKAKLSENGLLSAWAWKKYAEALPPDIGPVTLSCPIDCRRLSSQLTPAYFGNAVLPAIVELPREQILAQPISTLALMINEAVRSADEDRFNTFQAALELMRREGGINAMRKAALVNPQNGLLVTNVARFPHPPIDFGLGPCKEELTPVNYAGAAIIFAGAQSKIQIRISFPRGLRAAELQL